MSSRKSDFIGDIQSLLKEMAHLYRGDQTIAAEYRPVVKRPVGLIVGNPRSGSTILLQVLACSGSFAYPSNLISRFAFAPEFGGRVQQLLFDERFDPENTLADLRSSCSISLSSDLGKSQGALSTNEFYHFFRRYFPCQLPRELDQRERDSIDLQKMLNELERLAAVFRKPLVSKGYMFQYNLSFFSRKMPAIVWIRVKRNPIFIMQSIYQARIARGGLDKWWSVMPSEYEKLLKEDPFTQIAGQVFYTEKALDQGFSTLPEEKRLVVPYEEFCRDPRSYVERIKDLLGVGEGPDSTGAHPIPGRLKNTNQLRISPAEMTKLEDAYRNFTGRI